MTNWQEVAGGVCAPQGFQAGGVHCGVKKGSSPDKYDLAMIVSDKECVAAGVYTMNRVKAAPVYVTMEHLENGVAWGVVANSGNANACCPMSHENARAMAKAAAAATGHGVEDFAVASTGVIGQTINIAAIETGIEQLAKQISHKGSDAAANAIMTTDTKPKQIALTLTIGGKEVKLGAIAKGSGMIHPHMGTMLAFVTTDCAISREMLGEALHTVVGQTFNRVVVDGVSSTNDMCVVLANGAAENQMIEWKDADFDAFQAALLHVCRFLARSIAGDGEGATKLVSCKVSSARSEQSAERLARAVVAYDLVKAAMYGRDANWGRVLCAMGDSQAPFRPEYVDVGFSSCAGAVQVCEKGDGLPFDEAFASKILSEDEVIIDISLNEGEHSAECWGCDLTCEYVKINSDYRS